MRFLFFSLLLVFTFSPLFAQPNKKLDSTFKFKLVGGLDFYRAEISGERLEPIARPFFGLEVEQIIKGNLSYALGFQYYNRASSYTPSVKLVEEGFAFLVGPRYQLGDFSFYLNGVISTANSQRFERISSSTYDEPLPELANISNIRFQFGGEVNLMRNLSFFMDRSLILDESGTYTNQVGIKYTIGPRREVSQRRIRRTVAYRQIRDLKDGLLLVRLENPQASLTAMRRHGEQKRADKLEDRIDDRNRLLMSSFASEYDFSKVYYFFSQHSDSVRQRKLDGILYDEDFNLIRNTRPLDSLKIFTAQFGEIGQDSLKYFDHVEHTVGESAFSNKAVDRFYGGTENNFDAIVISDQNFNQLSRPFPYYSRWILPAFQQHPEQILFLSPIIVFLNYKVEGSVKRLNKRLKKYYYRQFQQ